MNLANDYNVPDDFDPDEDLEFLLESSDEEAGGGGITTRGGDSAGDGEGSTKAHENVRIASVVASPGSVSLPTPSALPTVNINQAFRRGLKLSFFAPPRASAEEKLAMLRRYSEEQMIAKELQIQEKSVAGKIADEIRLARKKKTVVEGREESSSSAYAWYEWVTGSNGGGGEGAEGTPSLFEFWEKAFHPLIHGEEYDTRARSGDRALRDFIVKRGKGAGGGSWQEFSTLFIAIVTRSPRHSLSRCLRVFSRTLCILHGPLFDMEQEMGQMLRANPNVTASISKFQDLVCDLKCFEQMLVHTIAYKFDIDVLEYKEPLFASAQCAIYGFVGRRVDAAIEENFAVKTGGSASTAGVDGTFESLGVPVHFRGFNPDSLGVAKPMAGHSPAADGNLGNKAAPLWIPYQEATRLIRTIPEATYPFARLKIMSKVCHSITATATSFAKSYGKNASVAADDLLPLTAYVISKANVKTFGAILHGLECLIPDEFLSGSLAYALATCQGAYFSSSGDQANG